MLRRGVCFGMKHQPQFQFLGNPTEFYGLAAGVAGAAFVAAAPTTPAATAARPATAFDDGCRFRLSRAFGITHQHADPDPAAFVRFAGIVVVVFVFEMLGREPGGDIDALVKANHDLATTGVKCRALADT